MDGANLSVVSEFVFLGLSNSWVIQLLLFVFSSVFYMASLVGNLLLVFSVTSDSNLHSPVYFLLANLSFLDLGVCSIAAPKMIYDLFRKSKAISSGGCITQIFFIHAVGGTEMVLLIAMAFDRYVTCPSVAIMYWTTFTVISLSSLNLLVQTSRLEFMVTANSGLISVGPFSILIISYTFILVTVQKHSSSGLSKALSTLSAHVTVVVLFFGPLIFFYIWPFPSSHLDKFLAIFDAVLTPFLNPVIYTFRNKEMKAAMKKICHQLVSCRKMS
uniref:G-protein coupled receptors family 1 profile domain-containing protein n=1 Tax=Nomascus leucogenys TaxID=61853 RepID=A0A2I3HZP1_NOMLE